MPSFQDSAVLILIALLLFGPKGLAKIARQAGKLMAEFRRASTDFRMQMEDEFRIEEQAEQQKKIAAMEAAAPVAPLLHADLPDPEHPHLDASVEAPEITATHPIDVYAAGELAQAECAEPHAEVLPIASSGDLHLMPPATGLPVSRSGSSSSLSGAFDSIPHVPEPTPATHDPAAEVHSNG